MTPRVRRLRSWPASSAVFLATTTAVAGPVAATTDRDACTVPSLCVEDLPSPIDGAGTDALHAVGGYQFLYLAGAIAATAALSPTGADHSIRVAVQEHARVPAWGDAAYYGGYVLPIVAPVSIYVAGLIAHDRDYAGAGSAAIQSLVFTELVTVVLKVGTGRPFPLHGGDPSAAERLKHPEYAREFTPFGFAGRYAWPSGHTAAAVSIAAALTAYSDDPWLVGGISYPIAAAIAFGMLTGDRHWASDVVAGASLAQGIGWSVGKSFAARARGRRDEGAQVSVVPLVLPGVQGLAIAGVL